MGNPFAIEKSINDELTVVVIQGFVDAHTAPRFEEQVQEEIDAGRCRILVDCSQLSYISSAGMGVFMGFVEDARELGGDIKIAGVIPKVRQVFELLGFDVIFDILDDVPSAMQRFADGQMGPNDSGA